MTLFSYVGAYFQIELCHMKKAKKNIGEISTGDCCNAYGVASLRVSRQTNYHKKTHQKHVQRDFVETRTQQEAQIKSRKPLAHEKKQSALEASKKTEKARLKPPQPGSGEVNLARKCSHLKYS
jgi:hypothetical protein